MSNQSKNWKFAKVLTALFLMLSALDIPVYAQAFNQSSLLSQAADISHPTDADIQAVQALSHGYGLESLYYSPSIPPFSVNRGNFAFTLVVILRTIDNLIATGAIDPVKPEDAAIVQHLRAAYGASLTSERAYLDYVDAAYPLKKPQLFLTSTSKTAGSLKSEGTPPGEEIVSPCFHPTFLQPDDVNVQALRLLAKKYDVLLPSSKLSTTPALLEDRPIARHEFAAALDPVLTKTVKLYKADHKLVPEADRVTLQRLADEYAIELTPEVLFGVHTKLYTYCLN